jgi:hypothetical protein
VNAGIVGAEDLTLDELARGADVLFAFLRLPEGSALPAGFYTVRIFRVPETTQWRAQLKDLQGRVALETDAEVGEESAAARPRFTGSIKCDAQGNCTVTIDFHWGSHRVGVGIPMGTGGPDPTLLPPAGRRIVQATTAFQEVAHTVNNSKSNNYRVTMGTRDDALVVQSLFRGVEDLTLEQLAEGQDVFFGYYRLPATSPIPPGFHVVRIFRDPAGRWVAQIRDGRGRVVKEDGVIVESDGPMGRVVLSLDVSANSATTGVVLPQGLAIHDCACPGE